MLGHLQRLFGPANLTDITPLRVEGYQNKLLATKKLPSSIFDQMFPGTITRHLEYLDQTSVQEAIELRPK